MIIGRQGRAIRQFKAKIEGLMTGPHWGEEIVGGYGDACPSLHLKVNNGDLTQRPVNPQLTLTLRWVVPWPRGSPEPQRVQDTADAVKQAAVLHCNGLHRQRS